MRQRVLLRARIVALSLEGFAPSTVATLTERDVSTVERWVSRAEEGGLLTDLTRSGRPKTFSESMRLKTIAVYCQQAPPLPGVHSWSLSDAHRYFNQHTDILGAPIGRASIHRILLEHALRPHRRQYYLQITDPDFFPKMEHITTLYLDPPPLLFCFDECTCIQALERLSPDLPPDPHQPLLEDFDYRRGGTTELLAFLNPASGEIHGRCAPDHNRHTLSRVFTDHVQTLPRDAAIHYVMDNLSPHYHDDFCQTVAELSGVPYTPLKTGAQRRQWLGSEDKRIVVHFVPFHASWLNRIEIWFGILKKKCLSYGHFLSLEQLRQDILDFIDTWNQHYAHPFSWSYTGEGLHAKALRRFCRLLAIETDQMDSAFLKKQLLLMSNLAKSYPAQIPSADWLKLLDLAAHKDAYITGIIEHESGPRRRQAARKAYENFHLAVLDQPEALLEAA